MSIISNVSTIFSSIDLIKDLATYVLLGSVSLGLAIDLCKSRSTIDTICKYLFALLSIGFLGSATLMLTELPSYLASVLSLDLLFFIGVVFSLGLAAHDALNKSFKFIVDTFAYHTAR